MFAITRYTNIISKLSPEFQLITVQLHLLFKLLVASVIYIYEFGTLQVE